MSLIDPPPPVAILYIAFNNNIAGLYQGLASGQTQISIYYTALCTPASVLFKSSVMIRFKLY